MRILQISPYYPPSVGGIQNVVETLSNLLVKAGHHVTVYTSNVPKTKTYENINGLEIYRFNCHFKPLNNPFIPAILIELLRNNTFDIVHAHSHLHMTSNMAVLCKLFKKYPLILTSHGAVPNYTGINSIIEKTYHYTIGKWTLRSANKIIALSPKQADILVRLGAKQNSIAVIPNGIDFSQINLKADTNEFRNLYGLSRRKIVLFVGSLIPRKGLECLIESISLTKIKPIVLIIGDESEHKKGYRAILKHMVQEKGLEKDIIFVGALGKKMLELAYLSADIFVLPSLVEGLPLVLLEAMAYGRCALASRIPGNTDIIHNDENGLLFEPRNSLELAQKIDFLLNNEEQCRRLGENGRQRIEKTYNWDLIVGNISALYSDILKNNKLF